MPDKKVYTHGDAFALIDPTNEHPLGRTFFVLAVGNKAYLATKFGTILSDRTAPYEENELTEEGLKILAGKYDTLEVGVFPQCYGLMTDLVREKLENGKWAIEVFKDGKWQRNTENLKQELTYRGVQPKCQTCGHMVS